MHKRTSDSNDRADPLSTSSDLPGSAGPVSTRPGSGPDWRRVARNALSATPSVAVHLPLLAIPFVEFSWSYAVWVVVLTMAIGMGITVGFHRCLSHRAFKTSRVVQFGLAVAGCTALQKGPLWWASYHRLHHRHSDSPGDPHSPVLDGFFYSHMGWLFARDLMRPDTRVVHDLRRHPELVWLDRLWMLPGLLLAGTCFAIGDWGGLVYGYCLSVVLVLQLTFAVNSIGHLLGPRRFDTGEGSRNNPVLGYLAMGDGWHNNHHRAPSSARHGFAWYELDVSYVFIRLMKVVGLAWDVKQPPPDLMSGK